MKSANPATGETRLEFAEHDDDEVEARLARAAAAFPRLRAAGFEARAAAMRRAADLFERERERFARMMTLEMGKPIRAAVAEAEKCAWCCRHYAEHAQHYLADEHVSTGARASYVRYLPLGPVLAIMPWNFPFWQVVRFAAPALMAGNVALLKHASNVPECALALEDVFARAGFEAGAFQTLMIGASRVQRVIDDARVRAVTLTGSDGAGVAVAIAAGRQLKKSVLELGGSDAFVVMPSAELDAAVAAAAAARLINNGQSCIAAKRFIVHADVYDAFARAFTAKIAAARVGDPLDPATEVGPLATADGVDSLAEQVERAVAAGARVLTGGRRLDGPGWFYEPTVLADVPAGAAIRHEEVFGPVAVLYRARDAAEAIAIANDCPFGLGSAVWTRDDAEAQRFIDELDAGATFVNAQVVSDPRLPFGGVKRSGWGRELAAPGIREFTNVKTVYVK
jgi:succinate-semialdehyde dehydrogenase / glutarate-semialdehyde dehydrogenase